MSDTEASGLEPTEADYDRFFEFNDGPGDGVTEEDVQERFDQWWNDRLAKARVRHDRAE